MKHVTFSHKSKAQIKCLKHNAALEEHLKSSDVSIKYGF
jgi:hypothetical protein